MDAALTLSVLTGRDPAFAACVPDFARLRITVFRDYPYLYDGSPAYEEKYLKTYTDCPDSVAVVVRNGATIVGASTGLPLMAETPECQYPFLAHGLNPAEIFYCGESVLLPAYRGRGVYREFFAGRERHARALGAFRMMALCGVVRPDNHPRRPADYVPLDEVWQKFGYIRHPELVAQFEWQDVDEAAPSVKDMLFWLKIL